MSDAEKKVLAKQRSVFVWGVQRETDPCSGQVLIFYYRGQVKGFQKQFKQNFHKLTYDFYVDLYHDVVTSSVPDYMHGLGLSIW